MKTTLYLGTNPSHYPADGHLIHYPVIQIVPRSIDSPEIKKAFECLDKFTHFVFTSKNAVRIFFSFLKELGKDKRLLEKKILIAVGQITGLYVKNEGFTPTFIAEEETQEGIIKELEKLNLENALFFLPRSSLSRPALTDFFQRKAIRYEVCDLYDTEFQKMEPVPDLRMIDEIVFTSPSTVKGFLEIFGVIPRKKKIVAIGPITEEAIRSAL